MATAALLPSDEFFSESYMDAFYKAHVASSRSRGSGTLDEDIAAIEAEIRKVQHYRSKFRSYRCNQRQQQQLNSCGNSECSDEEDAEDASPTSVFKVYDSSCSKMENGLSPHTCHKSPDIFTWAAAQQVQHDHNYCCDVSTEQPHSTAIDHGTININTVRWQELSPAGRALTVHKLSCILQQKPSGRQSPTFCSLDWLPTSLVNWIKKTGTLGLSYSDPHTPTLITTHPSLKSPHAHTAKTNLGNEFTLTPAPRAQANFGTSSGSTNKRSLHAPTSSSKASTRHRRKAAPYGRITRQLNHVEITRVRNISSCSEGEDSVVID